jgi:transcriptional regulator with XRE-family HTH domain
MTVKERLIEYIKYKQISTREFCRTINVSETYVNSMRSSIQPDKLVRIAYHYPDLNTTWLMTGEGEMLKANAILPPIERDELMAAGVEIFKDKLIEMFKNGEIYSATVVKEKDDLIRELFAQITKLKHELDEAKNRLAQYES